MSNPQGKNRGDCIAASTKFPPVEKLPDADLISLVLAARNRSYFTWTAREKDGLRELQRRENRSGGMEVYP